MGLGAGHDYCYCYLSYFGFIRGAKVLQGFWQRCEARSIEPNPYRSGFLQLVAVAETDAAAEREYYAHADYFYNKCLHVCEGFADAPGYRTMATLRAGFVPQVGDRPARLRSKLSWKDMLEQGYVIGGSPAAYVSGSSMPLKNCIPAISWSCVSSAVCRRVGAPEH